MNQSKRLFTAEFTQERDFVSAARALKEKGYVINAYTPFYIPEVSELLGKRNKRIQFVAILGALAGLAGGYFLQYYAAVRSYPMNVGGRPLHSVPAFIQVTFETTVLLSSLATVGALFFVLRLPKLHQPVFDLPNFRRVTSDTFLLVVEEAGFEGRESVESLLLEFHPREVKDVGP